ncbi:glycoside hydrolase family 38 [Anaerobacillus alkaliphilus]|uniref:Glycoside hydrolase family 38 n=1 Tax=Anaerobacillus alkaliphilus TaxID=1548597 RepID=A0A4V1LGL5_9BACI|nr:glycoside hydrolase family 38 C-terminal domain-containing protein [Anaerobacillus alkaliphilus]RXJ02179.1 glycoside hydrolase family 38 [Anaerobacillus alkaliphilus]
MTEKRFTCHIVFQTHWDREWYFPFEVFRHRLVQVMKRIVTGLENGEIKQFVLDGQMAALEDYLEVCEPSMAERVQSLIQSEKIIIGPWYVLADEFLVSGESLVRNLEIGLKQTEQYGKSQKVGYLPDTFGHISQMPQLLTQFGIDNAVLWRGLDSNQSELYWQAPNGSKVFTVFLPEGYYQPLLDSENPTEALTNYVEKIKPYATTSQLLLTNGGDHLMPQYGNKTAQISELDIADVEFIESTYENFIRELQREAGNDLPTHVGEMRSNAKAYILPNVLSTRTYLKEQNQRMEDELTGYTEPLLALTTKAEDHPDRYLENTWKLLIKNHPHDSICGCSVDEVHREMETRTMKLEQRLASLQTEALTNAGIVDPTISGTGAWKPFRDDSVFTVFNPHPRFFSGWVQGTIWLEKSVESFQLKDRDGNIYQPTILATEQGRYFESPLDGFPEFRDGTFMTIGFQAKLAATSLTSFEVVEGTANVFTKVKDSLIENECLLIQLEQDGTLTMTNKETGKTYHGLQQFYSSLDAGDEYNYSPPVNDLVSVARLASRPLVQKAAGVELLTYQLELELPSGLNEERTGPSTTLVKNRIDVSLQVTANNPQANVTISVENHAQDQRLRVKFPIGSEITKTYSDSAFDVVERPAIKEEQFDAPKQKEVPVVVEPSLSFVRVEELAFIHRGLQEYQIVDDSLDVTVIRSVGWLSRDDLRTRGGGAGPHMATPEGQCLGTYSFTYAISIANETNGELATRAHQFRVPPKFVRGSQLATANERMVEIDNERLQWSSLRRVGNAIFLRLWNPTDEDEEFKLRGVQKVTKVKLNGEEVESDYRLAPREIATFRLEFEEGK